MNDAREAFQNLQEITGRGFEATAVHADLEEVERRIVRHRAARVVLSSFVAVAVVGGAAWGASALPASGDETPAAPPSAAASHVTPEPEVSMSVFGEPYPQWYSPPSLVDLVPGGDGGSLISEDDTTYTFGLLRPDPDTGDTVTVPVTFSKGDVLVSAATDWQCAWIAEYTRAADAGDASRTADAVLQVVKIPELDVIQKYNPEMGEDERTTLIPRIIGDVDFAKRWLNGSCGGLE